MPETEEAGQADPAAIPAWPDLLLIDGGIGQMNAATDDPRGSRHRPTVDRDRRRQGHGPRRRTRRFFIPGKPDFTLPPRDPVLYFIQRLRDEAHRFAIGSHRARRKKEMVQNPLDEIGGIGPARKRALLHHFGTAKGVSRAALDDLEKVEGISERWRTDLRPFPRQVGKSICGATRHGG
jgi:excinuclease ABC subunit C